MEDDLDQLSEEQLSLTRRTLKTFTQDRQLNCGLYFYVSDCLACQFYTSILGCTTGYI